MARDTEPESLLSPFKRVFRALVELVAHAIVVIGLLLAIYVTEYVAKRLLGENYVFFHRIPIKYLFDGADLLILVGFLVWGVYSVVKAYVRKPTTPQPTTRP